MPPLPPQTGQVQHPVLRRNCTSTFAHEIIMWAYESERKQPTFMTLQIICPLSNEAIINTREGWSESNAYQLTLAYKVFKQAN